MQSQTLLAQYSETGSEDEWNLYKKKSSYILKTDFSLPEEVLLIVPEAHFQLIEDGRLRLTMDHEGDFKLLSTEVCEEPITEVLTFKNQDSTSLNFFPKDVVCYTNRDPVDDELSGYDQVSTSLLDEDANICSFSGGSNKITYSIEQKNIVFSRKFSGRFYLTFKKRYFKLLLVVRSLRPSSAQERSSQIFTRTALSSTADFINDEKTVFLDDVSDTDLHLYAESADPEVEASAQLTLKSNTSRGSSRSSSSKDQKKDIEDIPIKVTRSSTRFDATASLVAKNMKDFYPDVFLAKTDQPSPSSGGMSVSGNQIGINLFADSKLFDAPKRARLVITIPEAVATLGLKLIPLGERNFSKPFYIQLSARSVNLSPPAPKATDTKPNDDKKQNVSSNSSCSSLVNSNENSLKKTSNDENVAIVFFASVEWHIEIPDRFNNWYCKFFGPAREVPYTLVKPIHNLAASTSVNDSVSVNHFSEDMTQSSLGGAVATNTIIVKENQFYGHRERLIVDGVEESTFSGEKKPLVVDGAETYTDAEFNAMKTIATFGSGFSPGISGSAHVKDRLSLTSGAQGHVQLDADQDAALYGAATTLASVNHSGPNTQAGYTIQQAVTVQAFMPSRTKEDIPLEIKCVLEAGPGVKITSAGASDQQSSTAKSSVSFNLPNGPAVIDESKEDGGLGRMSASAQAGKAEYTIQTSTKSLVNGLFSVGYLSYSFSTGSYLVTDFHVDSTHYKTIKHTSRTATLTLTEGLFSAEVSIKQPDWSKNLIVTDANGAILPTNTALPLPRTTTTVDLTPTY